MIEKAPELSLAGKAMNGRFALQKIPKLQPELIVLDLEMPDMNGIEFLKERRRLKIDIPVIILSSIARKGAKVTMEALALGASDFIMKPSGSVSEDIHLVEKNLVELARAYGSKYKKRKNIGQVSKPEPIDPSTVQHDTFRILKEIETSAALNRTQIQPQIQKTRQKELKPAKTPVDLVAIGISTGGPNALRQVFKEIDSDFPVPIVVVQHMPAGFTDEFANSLNRLCPLEVKEAKDGDLVKPGRILIAPGNKHLLVEKRSLATIARLSDSPQVNGHRPSVDILFESAAKYYGSRVLGVIMTGMGRDGAKEIGSIQKAGGVTIAQDEETSVVFGMPKVAIEYGHIEYIMPLEKIAESLNYLAKTR